MALFNTLVLGDIGFQLFFVATLGLILYAEPLSCGFEQLAVRRLSPEPAHRLDWLMVAGSGEEQLQGLPANLERFPPNRVMWSGARAAPNDL